jgi:signal transduction histidine kinase
MADPAPVSAWTRMRQRMDTIRVRTTGAAVVAVGVTLVAASIAMVVLLEASLRDNVQTSAVARAESVAGGLEAGEDPSTLTALDEDEEFVQILDPRGVVAASMNVSDTDPLVRLEPGQERTLDEVPFEDGAFLAVAVGAQAASGPATVVVGRSLEVVQETHGRMLGLLAVGVPLLLLVVGIVTWRVVGRALAPVDAIRVEVEAISSRELHRRVPQPTGKDEIARLASTMNGMLTRLEDARLRERRFVSDASHELRSPVAAIRQYAEVAHSYPEGTTTQELADVVLEEDVRLQRIVEDLLLLTRVDEGTLPLRRTSVDVDDLLFDDVKRLRASTELRVDGSGVSAGRVVGDRQHLERLIRNLTDNAARHAAHEVRLALREDDGHVILEVDDDGPGVPEEMREAVFERFTRLDDARDRQHGGAGLGLAIVSEIARAHGGSVEVTDAPLGGARFTVTLPAAGA